MEKGKNPKGKGIVVQHLLDQHGNSYIMWVVLVIVMCLLMAFILSYIMSITMIARQMDVAKNILDKQLSTNAVMIFQEIKEQDDYTNRDFVTTFINELADECGLEALGTTNYQAVAENGDTRYVVTIPTITYEEDFSPKLVLRYTITVPLVFAGLEPLWVDVPVVIVSRFNPKYDMS